MPENETRPSASRSRRSRRKAEDRNRLASTPRPASNSRPSTRGESRARRTLDTPEQRYRLLFERNLAGVYCTTMEGRILDCNESLARMLGKDGTPIHILENVILVPDEQGAPTIIQGTMVDITERKIAEEALRDSEQRYRVLADNLRRVMQRMHSIREDDRARIARELHDELGQALTALNLDLHWLHGRSWHESDVTRARISSMCDLVNSTIRAVHRICSDLRPTILDDFGLTAAIEWQAREFQSRTGIRGEVSVPRALPRLADEQAIAVFRILQESLTNIARHAQATEVKVTLDLDADMLILKVTDNGIGITEEQAGGPLSVGLAGMRERALRWEGRVEISGIPGQGTTVVLYMPIEKHGARPER